MAQIVEFEGEDFEFPDEASYEQIKNYFRKKKGMVKGADGKWSTGKVEALETPEIPEEEKKVLPSVEEEADGMPDITSLINNAATTVGDASNAMRDALWDGYPTIGDSKKSPENASESVTAASTRPTNTPYNDSTSYIKMANADVSAADKEMVSQATKEREAEDFMYAVERARKHNREKYEGMSDLDVAYDLSVQNRIADAAELAADVGLTAATGGIGAGGRLAARVGKEAAKGAGIAATSGAVGNVVAGRDILDDIETDLLLGAAGGSVAGAMSPSNMASKSDTEVNRIYDKLTSEEAALKAATDKGEGVKDIKQLMEDLEKGDYDRAASREQAHKIIEEHNPVLADIITDSISGNAQIRGEAGDFLESNAGKIKQAVDNIVTNAKDQIEREIKDVDTSYTSIAQQLKNAKGNPLKTAAVDTAELSDASTFSKISKIMEDLVGGGLTSQAKEHVRKNLVDEINKDVANKLYDLRDKLAPQAADVSHKAGATSAAKTIEEIIPVANKLEEGGKVSAKDISQLSKALQRQEAPKDLITDLATVKDLGNKKDANKMLDAAKLALSGIVGVNTGGAATLAQAGLVGARTLAQKGKKAKILEAKDLFDAVKRGDMTDANVKELLGKIDTMEEGSAKDLLIKMIKMLDSSGSNEDVVITITEEDVKKARK